MLYAVADADVVIEPTLPMLPVCLKRSITAPLLLTFIMVIISFVALALIGVTLLVEGKIDEVLNSLFEKYGLPKHEDFKARNSEDESEAERLAEEYAKAIFSQEQA